MRALRYTGNTFIVIGLTFMLFALYSVVGTSQITKRHQTALADEFQSYLNDPTLGGPLPGEDPEPEASPAPRRSGPPPIARIKIPSANVDHIVVEGATLDALAYGPGRYLGTAPLGGRGSAAIAGHRTGWGSPFYSLDAVSPGDEITVETREATYTYRVTREIVVEPGDAWVLDGDPKSKASHKLTLTTCTPRYTSLNRLIVFADLVDTEPRESVGRWGGGGEEDERVGSGGRWQPNPGSSSTRSGRWSDGA